MQSANDSIRPITCWPFRWPSRRRSSASRSKRPAQAALLKGKIDKSLAALKEEQKVIEQQIKELIDADPRLKELFALMVSVPGVGPVIATELLITTNEMRTINDPKKLACHAGVAPFEYRSGSRIRGKTRVSHQARKRLKALIHMGTMSAIQVQGDLQDYYLRKLAEGKHTMLVLNAVRNNRTAEAADSPGLRRSASG